MLQPPQWVGLLLVSTQLPLQTTEGAGQLTLPLQVPAWQFWPGRQALPQRPQLRWSDMALVQRPSQGMRGMAQPRPQLPAEQTSFP